MKQALKGYMTSLPIYGSRFPHRVQNILLSDYCKRFGYTYVFGVVEVSIHSSHHVLMSLLQDNSFDGLLFFSVAMLPQSSDIRHAVYEILNRGKSIHFCLEQLSVYSRSDICNIEDMLQVRCALSKAPFQGQYNYEEITTSGFLDYLGIQADSY